MSIQFSRQTKDVILVHWDIGKHFESYRVRLYANSGAKCTKTNIHNVVFLVHDGDVASLCIHRMDFIFFLSGASVNSNILHGCIFSLNRTNRFQ